MPKACRYLMVRLQMEKDKFLGWAVLAKISEDGKSLGPGLRINQHTVNDALREVQILLLNVTQLDGRYNFKLVVAEEDEAENKDDTGSEDKVRMSQHGKSTLQRTVTQKVAAPAQGIRCYAEEGTWIHREDEEVPQTAPVGVIR